ncbi:hypothetical protein [Paenibacillus swuensis]|nr:hypothetical protein [Paenibacillus swuensis]
MADTDYGRKIVLLIVVAVVVASFLSGDGEDEDDTLGEDATSTPIIFGR